MTLSDERLRELAEFLRTPGSSASWGPKPYDECADAIDELLSRRASPHGEAGEQDAEPEYDRPDHHAIDGSGDVQPFSPTPSVETGRVTDTMVAALANSLFRDIGTVSDDAARRALEAALSASPGSSAGADKMWRANLQNAWAAIRMIREAVEEFGPVASLESEDANLLRGPEPVHAAEAIVEALSRVRAALASAPPQREGLERLADTIETMEHDMEGDNEFEVGYRLGFTTAADAAAECIRKRIRALTGADSNAAAEGGEL